MTPRTLAKARAAAEEMGATNVSRRERGERLQFADTTFDVVISNGVGDRHDPGQGRRL